MAGQVLRVERKSDAPLRILSVASALPYPPNDGTRIRTWNLLSRLSATEQVTLLTWSPPEVNRELVDVVRGTVDRLVMGEYCQSSKGLVARTRRRVRSIKSQLPSYVIERIERSSPVEGLAGDFDLAIAEDDSALFLMPPVFCPVVVHRHNIFTDTIEGLITSGGMGRARKMKWRSELPTWSRYDVSLSTRADLSIVTTNRSLGRLKRLVPDVNADIVSNGVEIPTAKLLPAMRPVATFIGQMNYEPNVDAMLRFVDQIWPQVRRQIPDAELRIIGREPLPALRRINAPGVKVVGEVADMVTACQGSRIGIVPLNAGSGIKNKTLELMAMGRAVVASPQGYEGIKAGPKQGLFRARTDDEVIGAISHLLRHPARAEFLGSAARRFAGKLSWDLSADRYLRVLRDLAGQSLGPASAALQLADDSFAA